MPTETCEVILTHEHTDFDAMASMLGAALLFPDALPVLPRQLNRNVNDFLSLYKNHFPFVADRDVPRRRVSCAILVDTRAVNWVKGMDGNTEFFIIDHHGDEGAGAGAEGPRTPDGSAPAELAAPRDISAGAHASPRTSQVWTARVGANTTILVEKLMEIDYLLSPLQATLLTLGIHEDTGSLTYPSTTDRDAACLAWLLQPQRTVNLAEVSHFLHHPLSDEQRKLLESLIHDSEFLEISGHTIVIAQARAPGLREEISALATRLRDFHETDAIFLIIDLGDIVQVVARSTTDEVDVGRIARELGGGGHTRAAAAPIHSPRPDTQSVRDQVVALVKAHSRSAVSVRNIMSMGRPHTLSPEMTIGEANELMRRWGHEGFPILRKTADGREELLGVLTRREADRALSHGLGDQPVTRFMRAGQVSVRPDDSVYTLRKVMIDSNWGQIPVVDEDDQIIGIVTRTDLIKLWDEASLPRRHAGQIAQRLIAALPAIQHYLLRLIGEEVDVMNYSVYIVGGFVRDLLLDNQSVSATALDMDIVIEGNAIEFAQRMRDLYGGRVVLHKRFGTAKWLLDDTDYPVQYDKLLSDLEPELRTLHLSTHLDFVTARTEFYTAPTVLPTVERSKIKLDLHRRDFTINTLALCLNPDRWGELLDSYGGLNDLREGVIRVLHSLSFVDDPTRILRAVRYEQRFRFRIDPRTLELLQDALELLDRVTPTRVRHEIQRILQEGEPERTLVRLDDLGVLARLYPDLHADAWVGEKYVELRQHLASPQADSRLAAEPIERLYWGLLAYRLPGEAEPHLNGRLGLRGETQRLVRGSILLRKHVDTLSIPGILPSRAVEILDEVHSVALALARIACSENAPLQEVLARYDAEWRHVHAELDGHDLAQLNLPRGLIYGRVLTALRAARLDGQISSRDEELAWATRVVEEKGA